MRQYVEVDSLTRRYDNFLLDKISFKMDEGTVFTLMGSSGSGKTSLLRNVCGLDRSDSGRVYVNQKDLTEVPTNLRNIGLIFQDLALFPHMSAFDNIAFGLRSRRLDRRTIDVKVEEMARKLDIAGLLERYPSEISGGERQRVALARSLVVEPSLLLMDEPLSSLDPQLRLRVRGELKALIKQLSLTIIYVTHDLEDGLYLGDSAGYMSNGKLIEVDTAEKIYSSPRSSELALFLGYNLLEIDGRKLAVHPRDIIMSMENPVMRGTVKSFGFEGADVRIDIVLEDGQYMTALVPYGEAMEKLGYGMTLGFTIARKLDLKE